MSLSLLYFEVIEIVAPFISEYLMALNVIAKCLMNTFDGAEGPSSPLCQKKTKRLGALKHLCQWAELETGLFAVGALSPPWSNTKDD